MTLKSKRVVVMLSLLLLVAIALLAFRGAKRPGASLSLPASCNEKYGLNICLGASKTNLAPDEEITFEASIKNVGAVDYKTTFSCTDTSPAYYANNRIVWFPGACGQAITDVVLSPGESQKYTRTITYDDFQSDSNDVVARWGDGVSGTVQVSRQPLTAADRASRFQTCQSHGRAYLPQYCKGFTIAIGSTSGPLTCEVVTSILQAVGLRPFCDPRDLATSKAAVFVPASEAESWREKLKTIQQVTILD